VPLPSNASQDFGFSSRSCRANNKYQFCLDVNKYITFRPDVNKYITSISSKLWSQKSRSGSWPRKQTAKEKNHRYDDLGFNSDHIEYADGFLIVASIHLQKIFLR
jgi:hypothetical protein